MFRSALLQIETPTIAIWRQRRGDRGADLYAVKRRLLNVIVLPEQLRTFRLQCSPLMTSANVALSGQTLRSQCLRFAGISIVIGGFCELGDDARLYTAR